MQLGRSRTPLPRRHADHAALHDLLLVLDLGFLQVADSHRWPQDKLLARRGERQWSGINQFRVAMGVEPYESVADG